MDINLYGAVMPHMLDNAGLGLTQASAGGHHGQLDHVRHARGRAHCGSAICATAGGVGVIGCGRFIADLELGGLMPLCLAMVMEFAPLRRAALITGLPMTSYHAGGMAATGLGLTLAPAAGWHWVFWAGVPPAVIAVPLLLTLLPEAPSVLPARGERDRAHAVADRYGLPRPTVVAAPAAGARGHLAAVRALFHPDARWATPLLRLASFCGLLLVLEPWPTVWAAEKTSRSSRRGAASSRRHSRYSPASSAAVSAWARASACAQEALTASPSSPRPHTGNPTPKR
jgi:AAHS family benzoate transporter-like MFS transporter